MTGFPRYRCVRSWDGQAVTFAHPDGRPPREWSYADGRAVMSAVIRAVFGGHPPPFHITFEPAHDRLGHELRERCFIIKAADGHANLQRST